MRPTFRVDYDEFKEQLMALAFASRREFSEVIQEQAKLTAFDLIKTTPPNDKQPINESFNLQKKKGEAAIRGDVSTLFQPLSSIAAYSAPTGRKRGKSGRFEPTALKKLAQEGKWDELSEMMFASGITKKKVDVVADVKEKDFLEYKNQLGLKPGRIKKDGYSRKLVYDGSAIARLVNELTDRVGWAKAGWMKAAKALGVQRIPGWITKHNAPGSFLDDSKDPDYPVITMFNNVKYVEKLNKGNRLLYRALKNRQRAMEIATEKAIEHFAAKFKG
jgi:hypothetical protein